MATNATIQITFASAVDASTVNATTIKVTDPNAVAGKVTYDTTTNMATFTPSAALPAGTAVTVSVSGVTAGGSPLATFTSSFTTAAPAGGTTQYQAELNHSSKSTGSGQVSVDTTGNVTLQYTGGTPNITMAFAFCEAQNVDIVQDTPVCINLGNVTSDSSGNAHATVKFPQAGQWVGDFGLYTGDPATTGAVYGTGLGQTSQTFVATLQAETKVNGGKLTRATTQDPLTTGTLTYSKGTLQVSVAGAAPNTTYDVLQSENLYMHSSGTYDIGEFTTDASGNGQLTIAMKDMGPAGDLFEVIPHAGGNAGFGGGFSVPKE